MINWKVRFKNWPWMAGFISQIMIVVQLVLVGLNGLGITEFQLTEDVKGWVLAVANAIFMLFAMLGLVQDPTTSGYGDSERAKKYNEPK
ncbi:phage holin [Neobacillus mesonae]|uniref:Phage holin n=1 Tax=Neobacillus mesonae TaxID=1193713 RepID=A0A3Q9QUW1_9BACI|nr:phage holin [Neobacillus mesonae]AZU61089.1 phage holin [Neobacillus mesonae]